jgi:formiminotetrahydrofolate cyclodeaminase
MSFLNEFIERVASDSPTPGGGSVSALASSLGCALTEMVSRISLKKKDEGSREAMRGVLERSAELRKRLIQLVEEDALAYQAVLDSLSLPKETSDEREKRKKALQEANVGAAKPPLEIEKLSLEVLEIAKAVAERGSRSACTDAGVAALMAYAGLHGGYLNVKVNLSSIKDENLKKRMEDEAREALEKGRELVESVLATVDSRLSFQ